MKNNFFFLFLIVVFTLLNAMSDEEIFERITTAGDYLKEDKVEEAQKELNKLKEDIEQETGKDILDVLTPEQIISSLIVQSGIYYVCQDLIAAGEGFSLACELALKECPEFIGVTYFYYADYFLSINNLKKAKQLAQISVDYEHEPAKILLERINLIFDERKDE